MLSNNLKTAVGLRPSRIRCRGLALIYGFRLKQLHVFANTFLFILFDYLWTTGIHML